MTTAVVTAVLKNKKEEEVPTRNGNRIIRIIRKGIMLKGKIDNFRKQLSENNEAVIPHAERHREKTGLKSATFKSVDGVVTIKFSETITYDPKDMETVKEILGPVFTQMFHEVPRFAVNSEDIPEIKRRLGKDFERLVKVQADYKHTTELMNLLADGDSKTARDLRDYVYIEARKPSVSYESW